MAEYISQYTGAQIDEAVRKVLNGEAGSATVTADSIKTALGYTPAKETDVEALEARIDGLGSGGTSNVPSYVTAEAERVAEAINDVRTAKSLVLLCASDIHTLMSYTPNVTATLHLAQGINEICKRVTVDGVVNLGDTVWGASTSTIQDCKDEYDHLRHNLGNTQGVPQIWLQGNHDNNSYNSSEDPLSADQLYAYIGANTADKAVTDYDNLHRLYGYVDYDRQKIRVIYLNTADSTDDPSTGYTVSTVQLQWLVDTLAAVPAGWGAVVMSHHPLNTSGGAATVVLTTLDAFKGKQSGTVSSVSYDFTDAKGELICHLHGHIHNYQAQTFGTNGVLSITIPNGCNGRENEYGTGGNTYWGDTDASGNQRKFVKTSGTAEDTAYTAVVIDRKNGVVHALRCGAGIDRTLAYNSDAEMFNVSMVLKNATSSNTATSVVGGMSYTTTLTANTGYTLDTVYVYMGNTDITATAYADGKITIPEVTAHITITAETVANGDSGSDEDFEYGEYTNLIESAQAMDSTALYNGTGYKNEYRLSTESPYESSASGYVATGLIPYSVPDTGVPGTIYIKGAEWSEVSNCRLLYFDASKAILYPQIKGGGAEGNSLGASYTLETLGDKYFKLTPIVDTDSSTGNWAAIGIAARVKDAEFFRISLAGAGDNLIITVDQQIHA